MAGTLQGQHILSRVQNILQDNTNVRWTEGELLDYLNDGQREIVNLRPDSTATHSNVSLSAGTEQSIPTDGLRLIKVVRNMSGTGTDATGARTIRLVDFEAINTFEPSWHDPTVTGDAAHGTQVKHYMFDIRDPRKFYVYPGVSGSAYVEVVYSKNPTNLTAGTDLIQVDDIFANALINFVLYRAFLKESEYANNVAVASGYFNAFNQTLLVGKQIEQLTNPKTEAIGG
jgi:hypothetical protein